MALPQANRKDNLFDNGLALLEQRNMEDEATLGLVVAGHQNREAKAGRVAEDFISQEREEMSKRILAELRSHKIMMENGWLEQTLGRHWPEVYELYNLASPLQVERLKEEVESLSTSLKTKEGQLQQLDQENTRCRKRLVTLRERVAKLEETSTGLEQEKSRLQLDLNHVQLDLQSSLSREGKLKATINAHSEELNSLQRDCIQWDQERQLLHQQIETGVQHAAENVKLKASNAALQAELASKREELLRAQRQQTEMLRQAQENLDKLGKEKERQEREMEAMKFDVPPVDPSIVLHRQVLSGPSWADQVEEEEELRIDALAGNPFQVLAAGYQHASTSTQAPAKRRMPKPDCVATIKDIPTSIRSSAFTLRLQDGNSQTYNASNTGKIGEKNTFATFTIDGGHVATPALRMEVILSPVPARSVRSSDTNFIKVSMTLPCGELTTAHGRTLAFLNNEFQFFRPEENAIDNPSEDLKQIFRLTSDKDPEEWRNRVFGMNWKVGGGVFHDNFDHATVRGILADGGGYHHEARANLQTMLALANKGAKVQMLWSPPTKREVKTAVRGLDCFKWSVQHGLFYLYPYINKDGEFTGAVEHIDTVGGGFLDRTKPSGKPAASSWYQFDLGYPIPNLTSYLIAVAVGQVRELEQVKISRDSLREGTHRGYIVASSEAQLAPDFEPRDSDWYVVYIQIKAGNFELKELLPKPAEMMELQWMHNEDKALRWQGPVVELTSNRELGLCHFVVFAEAQRRSVRPPVFQSLPDAFRMQPNGLPVSLEVTCRTELTEKEVDSLDQMLKQKNLWLGLTLMGKYEEAAKIPIEAAKPPFPVKNDTWRERTAVETEDYSDWLGWVQGKNTNWNLNQAQLKAITDLANPQRLSATQGPPGTGKSKTAGAIVAAMVKAGQKVLCVASSNAATDNLARAIQDAKPINQKMRIVRAHVPAAEYYVASAATDTPEVERRGESTGRLQRLLANFEMASLADIKQEDMERAQKQAREAHERHYDISLSVAVYEQARETRRVNENRVRNEVDEIAFAFAQQYLHLRELHAGAGVSGGDAALFRKSYLFLIQMVLKQVDVIITTCVNASAEILSSHFKPDALFVDEAGQVLDFELMLAATAYRTIRKIVLLGDQLQLRPTVASVGRNEFASARGSPLLARLPQINFLNTQYRMTEEISKYPNAVIYGGRIQDAESVKELSPVTIAAHKYFHEKIWPTNMKSLRATTEVLFADLPSSKEWRCDKSHSKENYPEARFFADHVVGLLEFGEKTIRPEDISIIVIYKAQMGLIRKMLRETLPSTEADAVELSTVDGFQGRQNKVVGLSWVGSGIGDKDSETYLSAFFRDAHRLCVAISRAQCAFLMAGNYWGMLKALESRNKGNGLKESVKLLDLLKMLKAHNEVVHYPANAYPDTSPQLAREERQRRESQLIRDSLTVDDARNDLGRNKRRAEPDDVRGSRGRGAHRGGGGGSGDRGGARGGGAAAAGDGGAAAGDGGAAAGDGGAPAGAARGGGNGGDRGDRGRGDRGGARGGRGGRGDWGRGGRGGRGGLGGGRGGRDNRGGRGAAAAT